MLGRCRLECDALAPIALGGLAAAVSTLSIESAQVQPPIAHLLSTGPGPLMCIG